VKIASLMTSDELGGAEYANANLVAGLVERGHDAVLVTDRPEVAHETGLRTRKVDLGPKLSTRSVARTVLTAPRTLWRLARALRAERPDVTLVHYKKEQLLTALLPRAVTGRRVWAEWGPVPFPMRQGLPKRAYRAAAARSTAIMAASEPTKRTITDLGVPAAKVTVVPNLVDTRVGPDAQARAELRAEWGAGPATFVIGCVSRFQAKKRNDVVVDAAIALGGDVLLVMGGDGDEEAALRERAEPLGDRARFVPTPGSWLARFLSACDVLVFAPSPTEGAPRAIILGQLTATPVVATAAEGADGLIEAGTGTIVTPGHDPEATAEALRGYRDDPDRRRREGAAARAMALERYDRDRVLATVERVLSS
jgi:glycosyltransferase involved in cell wall biosynthesis